MFLDNPCGGLQKAEITVSPEAIQEKMDWLRKHEESIVQWSIMMEAAGTILKFVRLNGYHQTTPEDLEALLSRFMTGPARGMIDEVLNFVRVQSSRVGNDRLPGSTEVLESLIGKGKQLTGSTKNGYTRSILGIAASVMEITSETVQTALQSIKVCDVKTCQTALQSIKVRDVKTWIKDKIGLSLQARKQRAIPACCSGTKTG